ncbi:carbamoyltransferase [Pelagibacteraceae bacterium]|nr:carbamoyltransferase [Pelagibacteraceae bacterium]
MKTILGISAFYHDSAAALIQNGEIIAAAQEERFTRIKHDSSFPTNSIKYVLSELKTKKLNLDYVVFYEKPFLKFERLLETYVANAPRGFRSFKTSMPIWLKEKLFQKSFLIKELKKIIKDFTEKKLYFSEHHLSHASSAFYPSPYNEAIILTLDGVGEWATTTISIGKENKIRILKEINFPHSIGLLYSAFTYYLGFKVNSGEYKVMGLAPYGQPIYKDIILNNLVDVKEDGSFKLNMSYFNYSTGLTMTNKKFNKLFKSSKREPESDLTQFHMDIASSIQEVIEEIIIKITKYLSKEFKITNLCLAGGVALNCVANSKILKAKHFENVWIQPSAGDAGGALGAALLLWHNELGNPRKKISKNFMCGSYLGPEFDDYEIEKSLTKCGARFEKLSYENLIKNTVNCLTENRAIGWFQGRMEFGPRALGGRSIIADPRSDSMQKNLNLKIKFRESFRPFAPSILREDLENWFNFNEDSPYMLFVCDIKNELRIINDVDKDYFGIEKLNIKRSKIPAVTHVDYSARIQTVHKATNPRYYDLILAFKKKTGCPLIVNTSFNVRGEPIVCSPTDAFNCFMGTELDNLVIGNYFLKKENQDKNLIKNYKENYNLD